MRKTHTIKSIAAEAGVSAATVSRVFNNKNPEKVSAKVRKKVRSIIEKYDFTPNSLAKNLVCGKSHFIGLQLLSVDNAMAMELISGIEKRAAAVGYNIILGVSNWDTAREECSVNAMIEKGVDGLLWFPRRINFEQEKYARLLSKIRDRNCPLVWLQKKLAAEFPAVFGNNENGGHMATRHAWDSGFQRIVFVGCSSEEHSCQRFEGYKKLMAEKGLEPRFIESPHVQSASAAATLAFLEKSRDANAFVCASDFIALGVYDALTRKGAIVGRDYAVTGYDDEGFAKHLSPPLTTVSPLNAEIGGMAVEHLLKLMDKQSVASVAVEPRLVARTSCGEKDCPKDV